jgi:hypothetical protein
MNRYLSAANRTARSHSQRTYDAIEKLIEPRIISRPVLTAAATPIWQPYQHTPGSPAASDWRTFRVHHGRIYLESDAEKQLDPDNDDAAATPTNIIVPALSTNYKIWLELSFSISGGTLAVAEDTLTIKHGDSGWSVWPSPLASTTWNLLIAEIDTSNDTDKTATIYHHLQTHIRLPFLVPDPTEDPNPDATDCIHILLVQ